MNFLLNQNIIKNNKEKVIFLTSIVILCFCVVIIFQNFYTQKTHVVVLNETGFVPQKFSIMKNDTVLFINETQEAFWPASDLHPTHNNYPSFDSLGPIAPGESWTFVFKEEGVYSYHDHLKPLFEGLIVVGKNSNVRNKAFDKTIECQSLEQFSDKIRCWDKQLKEKYDEGGLKSAFATYEKLFNTQAAFAQECHGFTHTIGKKAFDEYLLRGDFDVTEQIAYCSYGFFHGFMDSLVQHTGNYEQSREFCDIIDKKIGEETNVYTACLHGIGHGVTDGYDPTAKDALAVVNPGLALCRQIGLTPYEVKICATGVFNSLAGLYESGILPFDKKDPLAICHEFGSEHDIKSACFDDMKTLLDTITNHNYLESAKFIEAIPEDDFAVAAIDNLSTYRVYRLLEPGFDEALRDCYKIQLRLQAACVRGISVGYMVQGTPGEEYVEAIKVCRSPLVKDEHREECFDRTMTFAQERYSAVEHKLLCDSVKDVYQGRGCQGYRAR